MRLLLCYAIKPTLHYIHSNSLSLFAEQIPGAGLGDPGRAGHPVILFILLSMHACVLIKIVVSKLG